MNFPNEIIKTQCDYLGELTDGKIVAKISEYNGPISDYTKFNIFSVLGSSLSSFSNEKVNIQEDLGDIGKSIFTFEFYITSIATPNYKYRILFLQYGITLFPTVIVLDEAIAEELKEEQNVICSSPNEFENKLKSILNSKKLEAVITALLAISQKEKSIFLPEV